MSKQESWRLELFQTKLVVVVMYSVWRRAVNYLFSIDNHSPVKSIFESVKVSIFVAEI